MRKLLFTMGLGLGLALSAGGCKDDLEKAMDEANALTDKMCACKDQACADKVRDQRRDLKKKFKSSLEGKKPGADQAARMEKLDERWRTCASKIEGA